MKSITGSSSRTGHGRLARLCTCHIRVEVVEADRPRLFAFRWVYADDAHLADGIVKASVGHIMQLGTPEQVRPGAIVQNIDPAQFAAASGLQVQPFFIEQAGPNADGLVRNWPAPSLGVEKHQGYAFQWYALAAMALLFFVITGFRRGPNPTK